jgi:hypothetical protein
MTYVTSARPDGFRALDIEHPQELNNLSKKELRSQTNHFFLFNHIF